MSHDFSEILRKCVRGHITCFFRQLFCLLFFWLFICAEFSYARDAYSEFCPLSNRIKAITAQKKIPDEDKKKLVEDYIDRILLLKEQYAQKADRLIQQCYNNYYTAIHNMIEQSSMALMSDAAYNQLIGDFYYFDADFETALTYYKITLTLNADDYQTQFRVLYTLNQITQKGELDSAKKMRLETELKKIYRQIVSNPKLPENYKTSFQQKFWYLLN